MKTITKRGCGFRAEGGIYAETRLVEHGGRPVEYYLLDPVNPMQIDTKVGVQLVESPDGVVHVLDWVGKGFYPYPVDFIEEAREMGVSRRLPKNLDFSLLTSKSRMILVHELCVRRIDNSLLVPILERVFKSRERHCRKLLFDQDDCHISDGSEHCSADHWLVGTDDTRLIGNRKVTMWPLPTEGVDYVSAAFMVSPISHIVGIASHEHSHNDTFVRVEEQLSDIPFEIVPA